MDRFGTISRTHTSREWLAGFFGLVKFSWTTCHCISAKEWCQGCIRELVVGEHCCDRSRIAGREGEVGDDRRKSPIVLKEGLGGVGRLLA